MYAVYCNNYDNAEQLLLKLLKKRKDFETAVNVRALFVLLLSLCVKEVFCLQNCLSNPRVIKGLRVDSFLIAPIQRILKYKLLIEVCCNSSSSRSPYRIQCNSSSNRSPYRIQCYSSSNRSPYRIQCNSSSNRSPYRIQCNSSSNSLPVGYSIIVALTGLLLGYSVIVALTGLPIGYSVIVALTGLPIGYSAQQL